MGSVALWVDDGKYLPPPSQEIMTDMEVLRLLTCLGENPRLPCSPEDGLVLERSSRINSCAKHAIGWKGIVLATAIPLIPLVPVILGASSGVVLVSSVVASSISGCMGMYLAGTLPDAASDANNDAQNTLNALHERIAEVARRALMIEGGRALLGGIERRGLHQKLQSLTSQIVPFNFFDSLRTE